MQTVDEAETTEIAGGVHLTPLATGELMSIQQYHIEPGARVPEHSHRHEQVGFLAEGSLTFLLKGAEHTVTAGGSFAIPGEEVHAAENRREEPARGVDIFSPPRDGFPE